MDWSKLLARSTFQLGFNINQQLENSWVGFNNYVIHIKTLSQNKSKESNINPVVLPWLGYFRFRIIGFGSCGRETWLGCFRFRTMGFGAWFVENKKKMVMGGGSLGNLEAL